MSASPHPPPPKSNPLSFSRSNAKSSNQSGGDPKWIGIQHSVETVFTSGGFKRAQIGEFHRLILLPPFNSAGQAKGEGRVAFKGKRPPPSLFPSSPPPLFFFPPFLSETGKKHFISVMKRKKEQKKRRKLSALKLCIGKGKFFE